MNTEVILIEENDILNAQSICNEIEDSHIRNRAVSNVLAPIIAARAFDNEEYDVDITSGLHNILEVLKDVDISDIYVNGSYIDARIYFEDDFIFVPKAHFDSGILPVAYMFIKLDTNLENAKVSGFILPQEVNTKCDVDGYYRVEEDSLLSLYDIESHLVNVQDTAEISEEELFDYADGKLTDKTALYKKLLLSVSSRERLHKICKFSNILDFVSINLEDIESVTKDSAEDVVDSADNSYSEDETALTEEYNQNFSTVTTPSLNEADLEMNLQENNAENENNEQIETLFTQELEANEQQDELKVQAHDDVIEDTKERKRKISPLVFILVILLGGLSFYGISTYMQSSTNEELPEPITNNSSVAEPENNKVQNSIQDAMPIESVENVKNIDNKEEAVSVSIPAIEKNLDASVLVSNLKVDWEVPSGYVTNTSAKRYLVKLGKIIQLNLKTELLLLDRPPITNKITVEIKYNNSSKKFETVGIVTSSGEKIIDDLILQTVNKALGMNISVNTDSFDKLQGNPVLIIKL